jgi:hypothetical protein
MTVSADEKVRSRVDVGEFMAALKHVAADEGKTPAEIVRELLSEDARIVAHLRYKK